MKRNKKIIVVSLVFTVILCLLVFKPKLVKNYNIKLNNVFNPRVGDLSEYLCNANQLPFNNSGSTLISTNVKDALDELYNAINSDCYVGYTKGTGDDTLYLCNKQTSHQPLESGLDYNANEIKYEKGGSTISISDAIKRISEKISYCKDNFSKQNETSNGYECKINTLPSTLNVTNGNINLTYAGGNKENAYSYDGDGIVTCSSSNKSYVTCSVDATNNKIIVTPVLATSSAVTITVSASATTNYFAPEAATFTVNVAKAASSITCANAQNWTGNPITTYTAHSGCTPSSNTSVSGANTYTVTCTGDANHNDSTCEFTINKVPATLTCKNRTYTGSAQNMYTNATGCASVTNGIQTNVKDTSATPGSWTLTCNPDDNHTAPTTGTCTARMDRAESNVTCNGAQTYSGSGITSYSSISNCSVTGNASPTNVGDYTVTCTASNNNYKDSTCSFKINTLTLTPSFSGCGKTYDGNTSAPCTITYSNVKSGDSVTGTATCTYADKNVGTGKTVTCSSFTKSGTGNANYSVPSGNKTTTANITAKALTATLSCSNKTYDGGTSASCSVTYATGISGESITGTASSCTFDNKNVGTSKTVTCTSFTKSGTGNENYSVPSSKTGTANITVLTLTATLSCSNKTYDGGTSASCSVTYNNVKSGDSVTGTASSCTFDNKNVGTSKTVTCTSFTKSGTGNGNYNVPSSKTGTANITALTLTPSFSGCGKTYNGNTTAPCTITYSNVKSGDSVTGTATCTYADANAGTNKTVTCKSFTKAGTGNGNYAVPSGNKTTTATISRKNVSFSCSPKTYTGYSQTACSCGDNQTMSGTYAATNYSKTAYTAYCTPDSNHTVNGSTSKQTATWHMNKGSTSITCNNPLTYNGKAQTTYSVASNCVSVTNGSVTNSGTYTVTCNGGDNRDSSRCNFTMNPKTITFYCAGTVMCVCTNGKTIPSSGSPYFTVTGDYVCALPPSSWNDTACDSRCASVGGSTQRHARCSGTVRCP